MPTCGAHRLLVDRWCAGRCAAVGGVVGALLVLATSSSFGQSSEFSSLTPLGPEASSGAVPALHPASVRSLRVELHYRLTAANSSERVALWYTRDLGSTWQRYGVDADGVSPMVFEAPAEGLYGVTLLPDGNEERRIAPQANEPPQRWLFLDETPPLVQWNRIEPGDDFSQKRMLHMRWTAHDSHLPARPVTLMYQSSLDQQWRLIGTELPNSGRFAWEVPAGLTGQVALKIIVRDRGGHAVERIYGPVPVSRWLEVPTTSQPAGTDVESLNREPRSGGSGPPLPHTQPAATTQPALARLVSPGDRQKARRLYEAAAGHRKRHEYDVAVERLKEALALDPQLLSARNDLAGLYYLQQDYDRAIGQYLEVLRRDGGHINALRGAALTYMATREYPKSQAMLKRVLELDGQDAASLLDLGDVLFMMGDENQARSSWEQAGLADATKEAVIAARARQRLKRLSAAMPEAQASSAR